MVGATAGEIVTTGGKVVGEHKGFEAFTIGQRKRLGVAMGEPHFVIRIEPDTRRVVIGRAEELLRPGLIADQCNWFVTPEELANAQSVGIQIRYNGQPHPGRVEIDASDPTQMKVMFDEPQSAVAPGQAAVVYDGERVLGGGWITHALDHVATVPPIM